MDQTWKVPVTGLANNEALSVKRGRLTLKSADVKEILEPVITKVVSLVLDQIRSTNGEIKAILLVGGFGTNMYLREQISKAVQGKIEVLQPPYGWSAAVRGAVMKGLALHHPSHAKVRLTSRMARKHIGIETSDTFDSKIHLASRKYFDSFEGLWMTSSMNWFIKKGETVNEDIPVEFPMYQSYLVSDDRPKKVAFNIYRDRTNRSAVVYRDKEVVKLAQLSVEINDFPYDAFDVDVGADGEKY